MADELERFVDRALERGLSRDDIRDALHRAGWPEDATDKALSAYADVDCPVPVPRPRRYLSAADTVLHLGVFGALYVWVFAWLWLLFIFVNAAYPDAAASPSDIEHMRSSIRWAIACLLIAYPLYLWLSLVARRALRSDPERRRSPIRTWLVWLTLLIAAMALLGDLVTALYRLLEGELTVRFLLKAAIIAGVAAGLLVHYRAEMKSGDGDGGASVAAHAARWLGAAAAVALVASVAAGFVLAGSPGSARVAALDERREQDLRAIARAVDQYWRRHERLPESLAALAGERDIGAVDIDDPESGRRYGYRATSDRSYRLCAAFSASDRDDDQHFWRHGSGRHCFDLTAPEVPGS